ncbi:Hydantoin racemase [Apiospora marii]|uniref:Hydantoin racemase n=1 Tax=Apiospora marii TaxID=335849 RepID=A0ABR1STV4_9PEZI
MSFQLVRPRPTRILVLNPNSSQSMTDGLKPVINSVDLGPTVEIHTYTAPSPSPPSINDADDILTSTDVVCRDLPEWDPAEPPRWDGVLVACFSVHPLVARFAPLVAAVNIFEAAVLRAMSLTYVHRGDKWGIVTTGKFWEEHLTEGVAEILGTGVPSGSGAKVPGGERFAGVESTGLNASDFHHGVDPAVVTKKIREATQRLLAKGTRDCRVSCIVMGCAGMAGLEETIRSAVCETEGEKFAYGVLHVVDGVRAGIVQIDQMIKDSRLRPRQAY